MRRPIVLLAAIKRARKVRGMLRQAITKTIYPLRQSPYLLALVLVCAALLLGTAVQTVYAAASSR